MKQPQSAPLVLIVDDEPQIRRLLRTLLEADGYRVALAATGGEGLTLAAQRPPAVILLDLGLPDLDGLEVLRRLRGWTAVPALILSVRESEAQKVAILDAGADDYVTKPFSSAELLARLRVLVRRSQSMVAAPSAVFRHGPLHLDLGRREVTLAGAPLHLTPTEYALLALFARHPGRVLTHRQILREIWGPNSEEHRQYLRVYVAHLRRKIETAGSDGLIRTEPGVGYRFAPAEQGGADSASDGARPIR